MPPIPHGGGVVSLPAMTEDGPADHVLANRVSWDADAHNWVERGRTSWAAEEITWGIWNVPESELRLLPEIRGLDVVELSCGTGYVSSWLSRRGARPVGLDNSARQLATARMFQDEFGIRFPLIHGDAERAPLRDGSFDLAISEYGAAIWADPYRWIPEAARLLRPGGHLIFLGNGTIFMLCVPEEADVPATTQLLRPYFGMHRFDWPDDESVEFHLGYGDWIRLLRANDFEVEDLIEIQPPEGSTSTFPYATLDWARRWPTEEIWKARKRGSMP
jgi:SAM-dependent methyltransferase